VPPHPSVPHCFPLQLGTHAQRPLASQADPERQVPHEPPHPSGPHSLPEQLGVQTH
jgi:hypothetical protein